MCSAWICHTIQVCSVLPVYISDSRSRYAYNSLVHESSLIVLICILLSMMFCFGNGVCTSPSGTLLSPVTSTSPVLNLVRTVSESRRFDAGVFDVLYDNRSDSDNSNSTNITGYIFRVEENIAGVYFIVQVVNIHCVCFSYYLLEIWEPMQIISAIV